MHAEVPLTFLQIVAPLMVALGLFPRVRFLKNRAGEFQRDHDRGLEPPT